MTTFTETITETFRIISCYSCSLRFGITSELYRRVVTDAEGSVYCPACGKLTCWRESEAQKKVKELEQKLRWEADNAARQKSAREAAENSLNAQKALVSRIKNRVGAGVCPCCNRTFRQLAAHIKMKHPDYTKA